MQQHWLGLARGLMARTVVATASITHLFFKCYPDPLGVRAKGVREEEQLAIAGRSAAEFRCLNNVQRLWYMRIVCKKCLVFCVWPLKLRRAPVLQKS